MKKILSLFRGIKQKLRSTVIKSKKSLVLLTIFGVTALGGGLTAIISVLAVGPFTITPNGGSYEGGEEITIIGSGFTDQVEGWTDKSYVAKSDMYIQLDAIQNRRSTPIEATSGTGATISDNTTAWEDLACNTYATGYANTSCEDFLLRGNNARWQLDPDYGTPRLNLNGSAYPNYAASTGNGALRISSSFNWSTLWTTSGAARTHTFEIGNRQNINGTALSVLYEYGTANTTAHSWHQYRNASATATYSSGNCYADLRNNTTGTARVARRWTCANDTTWDSMTTSFSRTALANSQYQYINGTLVTLASGNNTGYVFTPPSSSNFYVGGRAKTTATGGSALYNGSIRTFRVYDRLLTAQEIQCNYLVDRTRYEGYIISASEQAACATGATNITGTGIAKEVTVGEAPIVTIGGEVCQITSYNATEIKCTTPAGAVGRADVEVTPATSTGLSVQTYYSGYEYRDNSFNYEIMNTGVNPYTYAINPDTLEVNLSYTHASLITITYPRTSSDGSTTVLTNSVTMANSSTRTTIGGQCGGVTCATTTIKVTGSAANIDGTTGLIAFLKSLQWSGNAGYLRGDIRITVLPEDVEFWIDGDGNRHFYELVNSGNSALTWSQAYNLAANRTFKGLKGYLISMTEKAEADIILQYTENSGLSAVGYTSGIRFRRDNTANTTSSDDAQLRYPKVDATIGYAGNPVTEMYAMPTGQTSIGGTYGYACTAAAGLTTQGCSTGVAAITSNAVDACPSQAAYDTQWYWANPVDNGKEFYSGRVYTECMGNPLKTTDLTDYWNGAQPQGGETVMAYSSTSGSFGWHDYSNNAGSYYYVEYSEGWFDSGTYDQGETTYWSAPIPLEITIHHVRVNTGEVLSADTKAPSMGLNTTTNQFQCSLANGGKTIDGYYWSSSSCVNGQFPYDPSNTSQEITYYYTHNSVPNPVPFRMQRGEASGNYVYTMYTGDSGTAVNDFGDIRQIVITYPTELAFASILPGSWQATTIPGQTTINISQEYGVSATQVQTYLYTITLTASGMNDVTGAVTVEVADYPDVPATGDPGRTSSSGVLPQPVRYHYYRLGYTNDLLPIEETIGLINQSFNLSSPPQYLTNCAVACTSTGANELNANYAFYQASPAIGSTITYRGTSTDVYFYYQPANGLTVSFSMNGETAVESIPNQSVPSGDNAVRPPTDPVVLGKRFAGWFDTNTCANEFNFNNTPIIANTTIFACFTTEANMTVLFNDTSLAGTPEVSVNPDQLSNVVYNSLINEPTAPILPGYAFSSWNTEPMLDSTTCSGSPWNFATDRVSAPVGTSQITLYSCWEARGNVTINFNTTTNALATVQVLPNPTSRSVQYNGLTTPPTSPVSEGYAFVNWYTEPMVDATTCGGSVFNFTTTRLTAGSTTAYACWEKKANLTITFLKGDKDGDAGIQGWPTNVNDMPYNSAAAAYQPEVTLEGWRLSHWCESTNPNCSRNDRFDWSVRRTSSVTLIAMWREDIMAIDEIVPEFGSTAGGYRVTMYGSGFLSYDASSYAQNGLMVLLDGENNAGTLASPSHNASSTTWNNLAPSASTAFGNFALANTTVNASSVSFNGTSSSAKSGSTSNLNGTIGGTAISTVTTEAAYKQNSAGSTYSQLYEYGPFGYANSSYLQTFGEVLNASAHSTYGSGSCYIGQRTSTSAFTGGAGTCANNTISTTHTSIQSKSSGTPRRLVIDGNYSSPVVNTANTQTTFSATRSVVIGARTTNAGQTTYANYANVSISSFRMYNRTLTDTEIRCNYLVDLARFQGIFDGGLSACGSQLQPIMPDRLEINGEACTNVVISNEAQLTCTVPASTLQGNDTTAPYREGTVDAYIKIGDKEYTLTDGFTYQAPLTIFDISPAAGVDTGGNTITITGTDFRDLAVSPAGIPEVKIGENVCTNVTLLADNHSLTCVVPASTTGAGLADVTVTIPNRSQSEQSATVTNGYNYYSSISIDDVSPNVGDINGGTTITITGSGFGDVHLNYGVSLDYGGTEPVACIITSQTATTITCTTSARVNPGVVDVTVSNSVAYVTSVAAFTYVKPASSYINECYDEDEGVWANGDQHYIFIEQGSTAQCRLTLDAPYEGTVSLSDDYYDTIDPTLSGSFNSSDSRYLNGVFTLSYDDNDISSPTTGQVLYYTYTAPTASILEQYYDGSDTSEGYVGNGYDLYWPAIEITNSQNLPSGDSKLAVFGLLAQRYWVYPTGTNTVYVVGSNGVFTISTHGAYHPGVVSFSDDLMYSDDPSGTPGVFGADGTSPNNIVDLSELEGADSSFTYQPLTSATGLNYIRINGSSNPAINNTYYDIKVADSCLTVTGPSSMSRGQTAEFTLTASCGSSWSGSVELSDPFNSSGEVGGVFADTSTGSNPTGTFNAGTKTYTFTPGTNESYERTFNWTMRDDSITPPTFPSYIVYITVDDGAGASYTPVFVNADTLRFACASGYPNCTTGYVGSLFDVAISPNGMMIGKALVTTDGGGTLGNNGVATWNNSSDPYVMSATPRTPGIKTLTATVTESNNPAMVNDIFVSTDTTSFNDYIWVMANATSLTGADEGVNGKPITYTMTLNGPFEGTIELSDVLTGTSTNAGGTFSASSCTFNKANYDVQTNTTSCTFTYTPTAYTTNTSVTLRANKQSTYIQAVTSSTLDLTVYSPATINEVCRAGTGGNTGFPCDNSGSFAGGEAIIIRGTNFIPYNNDTPSVAVTFDINGTPATCSSVVVVDNNTITCTTPSHSVGVVDVTVNNGEEIATNVGGFVFRPALNTISPDSGFATGGGTLTITGGGFVTGQTIATIGENTCTNVTVVNSTTITCTAPASTLPDGGMGLVDVNVSVNGITAPTLANAYRYELALAISSITPNIGTPAGGVQVTIIGVGFASGQTAITIGGNQCTNVNVQNANQLTCTTPASTLLSENAEGVVSVTVSDNTNPSHTLNNSYTYRKPMEATIAAPNPVPTAGGTTFSVVGYNFIPPASYTGGAQTTVTFISNTDSSRLSCTNVNVASNMLVTCTTPSASVGTYNVEINNGYEITILTGVLTYEPNPMIVTDVDPPIGATTGGDTMTITGSGFGENHIPGTAYTRLEYLNFTGAQYINSNVNPATNFRVEADFQYNTVASGTASYLFGTRTGTSAGHFSFFKTTSNNFTDTWNTTTTNNTATFNTNRNYIVKENGNTFLNDTSIATRTGTTTATTRPLYIGTFNSNGSVGGSYYNGRIYSFKIYSAGTLVRDFIPACRNSDNVGGLYDLVNDTFYPSNSTTAFSCAGIPTIELHVEVGDNICTNSIIVSDTEITCTVPASTLSGDGSGTVDVYVEIGDQNNTLVGAYTYYNPASSYTNECRADASSDWEPELYVPQGSTVQCRVVLDNPYDGTISLSDDYWDTIDSNLSGVFSSTDSRFLSGSFSLTYDNTLSEGEQILYYTYTSPNSTTLDSYYEEYTDPQDCGERCDNGYDLYWPLLAVTPSTSLATSSGEVLLGLLAEKYYIFPDSDYGSYCVDCTVGFTLSTRGAPYFGVITLGDDLTNSNNPSGTSGVFSIGGANVNELDMSELDGGDGSFDYTPKTPATGTNYLRVYGESDDPVITDNYYDLTPVSQSTMTITGPTMLHRGATGSFTLILVDATGWAGTVALSDIFSVGGIAGGAFADTTNDGSYNSLTNTYTFQNNQNETYERTFTYTMPNSADLASYTIRLTGDNGTSTGYSNISVLADDLFTKCSVNYPNCTTAYVGEAKDLSIAPNGTLIGNGQVTDHSGGQITRGGAISWNNADPFVVSYTPVSAGHKTLTTTVTSTTNIYMDQESYNSTDSASLDSYIYVMANRMTLSGSNTILGGATKTYTLSLNGPFVGTIDLSDVYANGSLPAGGVFSQTACSFSLANYVYTNNNESLGTGTTTCTFQYTPATVSSNQTVRIGATVNGSYPHEMILTPANIVVRTPMTVSDVSPTYSFNDGGDTLTITGNNLNLVNSVQIGGETCTSLTIVSATSVTCEIPEYSGEGLVDIVIANSDGEQLTLQDSFEYFAPLIVTSIAPNSGPDRGNTIVTITGTGFIAPGFDSSDVSVLLDDAECIIGNHETDVTSTSITCTTSEHDAGTADVIVGNGDGTVELTGGFTYILSMAVDSVCQTGTGPTVDDDPGCRPYGASVGGDEVVITGDGFIASNDDGSSTTVTFDYDGNNPVECEITDITNTVITCTTGAHEPGLVSVLVENPSGSAEILAEPGNLPSDLPISGYLYVDTYINLTSDEVSYEVSPSIPENSDYTIAQIGTNNPTGYNLSMQSNNSELVCQTDDTKVIPSISTDGQLSSASTSTWGYNTVDPAGSWNNGIPATPTNWKVIPVSNSNTLYTSVSPALPNSEDEVALFFGTRITPIQTPCTYRQTLTITALADVW